MKVRDFAKTEGFDKNHTQVNFYHVDADGTHPYFNFWGSIACDKLLDLEIVKVSKSKHGDTIIMVDGNEAWSLLGYDKVDEE